MEMNTNPKNIVFNEDQGLGFREIHMPRLCPRLLSLRPMLAGVQLQHGSRLHHHHHQAAILGRCCRRKTPSNLSTQIPKPSNQNSQSLNSILSQMTIKETHTHTHRPLARKSQRRHLQKHLNIVISTSHTPTPQLTKDTTTP